MKKQKVKLSRKHFTGYDPAKRKYEVNTGASMTQVTDEIPMRELIENYTRGLIDPTMLRPGEYDENPEHDDDVSHRVARSKIELEEQAFDAGLIVQEFEKRKGQKVDTRPTDKDVHFDKNKASSTEEESEQKHDDEGKKQKND